MKMLFKQHFLKWLVGTTLANFQTVSPPPARSPFFPPPAVLSSFAARTRPDFAYQKKTEKCVCRNERSFIPTHTV